MTLAELYALVAGTGMEVWQVHGSQPPMVALVVDGAARLNARTGRPLFTVDEAGDHVVHWKQQWGAVVHAELAALFGDDVYASWFQSLAVEARDGDTLTVSLPVKFLRNWIADHYYDGLLACCRAEFPTVQRVELVVRSLFRTRL